jgi:hypothetical protein
MKYFELVLNKIIISLFQKFPFEYKSFSNEIISETNASRTSSPQTDVNINADIDSRSFTSTSTVGHESCNSPSLEFANHSSETITQSSNPLPQWEISSSGGPVVCAPPQYIYHQTGPHYYATNAPMAGHYFSPVPNGAMNMASNKDVNKMRSSGSIVVNTNGKTGKSMPNNDIRPPFYTQPNQYSEVNLQ